MSKRRKMSRGEGCPVNKIKNKEFLKCIATKTQTRLPLRKKKQQKINGLYNNSYRLIIRGRSK